MKTKLLNKQNVHFSRTIKLPLYAAITFMFATMPQPASAWTWARGGTVYNGSDLCIKSDAGIDHRQLNTLSGNLAYSTTYALSPGCGVGLNNRYAASKVEVYKWNGTSWGLCRSSDWKYGYTGTNQWGSFGPGQILDYGGTASCGVGYYGTFAYSYVWSGSSWLGGRLWSGYEYVQ
jgi:hypothetical protein